MTMMVPGEGDVFLSSDTVLNISWATCDVGVYPHSVNVALYSNGIFLGNLVTNLEDTGKSDPFFFRFISVPIA